MTVEVFALLEAEFIKSRPEDGEIEKGLVDIFATEEDFLERLDERPEGLYGGEVDDETAFGAGRIDTYVAYRDMIAQLGMNATTEQVFENPEAYETDDFYGQVHFDFSGAIGPETAKRLAKAYDEHEDAAAESMPDWMNYYRRWQRAFHAAAENDGFVVLTS